ncbi:hypothetical protein ACLOJK_016231, partial [Asimina triloba]
MGYALPKGGAGHLPICYASFHMGMGRGQLRSLKGRGRCFSLQVQSKEGVIASFRIAIDSYRKRFVSLLLPRRQRLKKHGYIGEFEFVDDHRAGKIVVELNGRSNKCGVISPRFDVGVKEIEPWTARLLPSRQFGYIVLTTSAGIMDHEEARRKNVGGKVL